MHPFNLTVLRGTVREDPVRRDLADGQTIAQFDVSTIVADVRCDVPVVVDAGALDCLRGDDVTVVGHVRRRFFRAAGAVQSRTEVVASQVIRASRRKAADRAIRAAADLLRPGE